MGQGMAQWFVQQGVEVYLVDISAEQAKKAQEKILASWNKLLEKKKFGPEEVEKFSKCLHASSLEKDFPQEIDLGIEAIIEDVSAKTNLFLGLIPRISKETILASNTSGLSINQLQAALPKEVRPHFLGLHFFNPATLMKLVEIIPGDETHSELTPSIKKWFQEKGKVVAQSKDSPGFIVNRVARNFYGESLRLSENSEENRWREIDSVMEECSGMRMGPYKLMDFIGIDINLTVTETLWRDFFLAERFRPHSLQKKMVSSRRLGRKTGRGFYSYGED